MDGGSTKGIAPWLRAGVVIGVGKEPMGTEGEIVLFSSANCGAESSLEPWVGLAALAGMTGMLGLPGFTSSTAAASGTAKLG